jgi:hypothetical protein
MKKHIEAKKKFDRSSSPLAMLIKNPEFADVITVIPASAHPDIAAFHIFSKKEPDFAEKVMGDCVTCPKQAQILNGINWMKSMDSVP